MEEQSQPINNWVPADTFIAGLVRGYLDTQDISKAIEFAQRCTTLVVQKHGVATVELKELQNG